MATEFEDFIDRLYPKLTAERIECLRLGLKIIEALPDLSREHLDRLDYKPESPKSNHLIRCAVAMALKSLETTRP